MAIPVAAYVVGSVLAALISGYGIRKQGQQASEQADMLARYRAEDLSQYKREYKDLQKEKRREWKWKEEDRNYQRGRQFVDRFTNFLDRDNVFRGQLLNIWGK